MRFDFTSVPDRYGNDALAVDAPTNYDFNFGEVEREPGYDVIPMWVADMNFRTAPSIRKAVVERAAHPSFGYFRPRDEYFDAIIRWQKDHNGLTVRRENIGYENGVLGGVASACRVLASSGDAILLHSPTYVGFTGVLTNNGYHIVHSPLINENGTWRMDYEDMERKIVDNNIKLAILCSPHNPSGRVWSREELEKAMEVYERHGVYVISDEIWSDILLNGSTHVPTLSISDYARDHVVALYAPSKTFSLAGLIGSYHIILNDWLKTRIDKEESLSHYNSLNVLSMHALIGAYSEEGRQWHEELKEVLSDNINWACDFIANELDGVRVNKPEGTYMLFIDIEEYCRNHAQSVEEVLHRGWKYGVYWQDGRPFHGEYNIRMNLALPKSRVIEAFERLKKEVF
ncbi:MAG: aminotransferase class I/II-fold pyridoxal phosphate-dependent enzyme [Erysipelotrichaceae bacterium]|nr:aminotransferase class I/II-fold pyridoxal phosphate-dependent enzyme [Erysipelotrichaceae bacterium]